MRISFQILIPWKVQLPLLSHQHISGMQSVINNTKSYLLLPDIARLTTLVLLPENQFLQKQPWLTADKINAVIIWTIFNTEAGYFFTNSLVKKIWNANPIAQINVSASPKPSVRLPFSERSATPITDNIAPIIPFAPIFFFRITNCYKWHNYYIKSS